MSRFDKWLPFFEESSQKRDVASWYACLGKHFLDKGLKVLNLVSDRAKALIKLGQSSYLNAYSMPDCFHFQQDIGRLAGLQIGKKHRQAQVAKSEVAKEQLSTAQWDKTISVYESYREQSRVINKTIHPFDESNNWADSAVINKNLLCAVRQISQLAEQIDIKVDLAKATKVIHQIPAITTGIDNWVKSSQAKIDTWLADGSINEEEKTWFSGYLLPCLYWQLQLNRTKNGRTNPKLVQYYENRMQTAQAATLKQMGSLNIGSHQQKLLVQMAYQMASSFQRASSQVEGRNGYLAFIHHGQKGIPSKKMKALTVIHNFDTRRNDGSTPAQRLFKKEFPNLFEFLCENVTGFKEPRKRKRKLLKTNSLQS